MAGLELVIDQDAAKLRTLELERELVDDAEGWLAIGADAQDP